MTAPNPLDISHLDAFLVVAGVSGAGKSKAVDAISDLGFFNIENVPIQLLEEFVDYSKAESQRFKKLVVIPDLRSEESVVQLLKEIDRVTPQKKLHLIFLDCANDIIVRRYSETRRPHPSFDPIKDKTLADAILRERSLLTPFRERAHLFVDTADLNIHELKRSLTAYVESIAVNTDYLLRVNFLSFGFKYGSPADCDIIIDVRFLPNPYFVETLRQFDGTDPKVASYVLDTPQCIEFMNRYVDLLGYLIPQYIHSGKAYLNVGVGCTGGKHRSVALAEALTKRLQHPAYLVSAKHRDKDI